MIGTHLRGIRLHWVIIAGAIVLTALGGWLSRRPRRLIEVEPGWLFRSGQLSPDIVEGTLDALDIDVIVDLTPDRGKRAAEVAAARDLEISWLSFPLQGDGTGRVSHYVGAVAAIDAAHRRGQRVLVHCYQGV